MKPAALDDRGARDIRGSGRTRTNETSNSADLGIDASGGKGQFKNPAPIKDNSPFKKPASLDGKGSFKNPASVGGLQTIDKSPIKPAALNGSVKPGLNKPFYSGQFKGASPACGHSVCGGHSGCSFSGHFSHHVSSCWYPSYGSYCNYGWGSGFGFWYGSSGWSIGFSYNSGYGWPYWGYNSCYWPSYWHGGYCGGYWPYRSHCYYPVYYPYYPYYYSSYYVPVYSDPIYYSVEETYVPAPAPYDEKQAAPAAENGWELLDQGDAREARRFFAREIGLHPNDGLPQIGYAIASTLIDRKIEAISMMRRAMKNDPEAILEVPQTQGIAQAIEAALDAYEDMSDRRPDNIDAQFMIAATRYMLGDISRAYFAADRAIDWGDKDASAANLRALLRKAIEQPAPPQLQPQPQPQSPPPGSSPAPPAQPVYGPPVNDPPPVPSVVPEEKPWEVPF